MSAPFDASGPLSRVRERVRVRARGLRLSSPDAERALWSALRNRQLGGHKFRRQHPVGFYFADFACLEAMLIVEIDGGQHFEPDAMVADAKRTAALNRAGFRVVRFSSRDVLTEREGVLTRVLGSLAANHHPHPSPLPPAGEGEHRSAP